MPALPRPVYMAVQCHVMWVTGVQTASAASLFVGVMRRRSEDAGVPFTDVDQTESDWIHCSANSQQEI